MDYKANYERWLNHPAMDAATKMELRNMGENINENDVYSFIDIGVVLHSNVKQGEKITRHIAQVMCLSRHNEKNEKVMIYEDGKILTKDIPEDILRKFKLQGIDNPFTR